MTDLRDFFGDDSPMIQHLPGFRPRPAQSWMAEAVAEAIKNQETIYGLTTGFGGMSNQTIDPEHSIDLQKNLLQFLSAGAGNEIHSAHTMGAMLLRANVLCRGLSGVRMEVIDRLALFAKRNAIPVVREYGSIGASGDLIPLSVIARAITGTTDRAKVRLDGQVQSSGEVLQQLGLSPIELKPKEGLALVNGTSFSSAAAANATIFARNGLATSFFIQSILMRALQVNLAPFDPFVHENKPHPGQVWSAKILRELLAGTDAPGEETTKPVQDRYSLRCAPQYFGSIVENLSQIQQTVVIEMNSVSDNPLVDPETGTFYQSGNFLGQYLGAAMDQLRRCIGLLAKHIDVQIASLVSPEFNGGLSASLTGNASVGYNMGLKGLQICGNSIMPLLTYLGNPIVEHFPTHAEQYNQNINGLSWNASQLAWNSVTTFNQYLAIASIFAVQSVDLRSKHLLGHFDGRSLLSPHQIEFYDSICRVVGVQPTASQPFLLDDGDRWLEEDVEKLASDFANQGEVLNSVGPVLQSFDQFSEQGK